MSELRSIRFGELSSGGGGASLEVEVYSYIDTINKVIGPIGNVPQSVSDSMMFWGPILQDYNIDYTIRPVAGGSTPGYYICISTTSSSPGGGTFSGGNNPSIGMEAFINSEDKITIQYQPA